MMNQALYPIEKIEWCIYALFEINYSKVGEYCVVDTKVRQANIAQSLDGYMWAVSPLKEEKIQVRCLTETTIQIVKPPLTMLYVGNGCEAYSTNIFIPAKSELTSHDPQLTRHTFFLDFNEEYQDLTKYSMIQDLHFEQLTPEERESLPGRLTALPPLQFIHLKRRIKPPPITKPPFKGGQGKVDNLQESVTQLLSLIKNPVGHMTKSLLSASLTDLPHSSGIPLCPIRKPQPRPRQDTLPPEEIELIAQVAASQQTLHEVAQELKQKEPKTYKGYIKQLKRKAEKTKEEDEQSLQ